MVEKPLKWTTGSLTSFLVVLHVMTQAGLVSLVMSSRTTERSVLWLQNDLWSIKLN